MGSTRNRRLVIRSIKGPLPLQPLLCPGNAGVSCLGVCGALPTTLPITKSIDARTHRSPHVRIDTRSTSSSYNTERKTSPEKAANSPRQPFGAPGRRATTKGVFGAPGCGATTTGDCPDDTAANYCAPSKGDRHPCHHTDTKSNVETNSHCNTTHTSATYTK